MTDRKKPDGSAYAAHKAALDERNAAARKIGKAERAVKELADDKARHATEKEQAASLRRQSERGGGNSQAT
jgi:hypothetical protein